MILVGAFLSALPVNSFQSSFWVPLSGAALISCRAAPAGAVGWTSCFHRRQGRTPAMELRRAQPRLLLLCRLSCSLIVWSEYLPAVTPLPMDLSITTHPVWTLAVASAAFLVLSGLLIRPPNGWIFAVRNSLTAAAGLYVLAVLFGSPLFCLRALAWAVYMAVVFTLNEPRDWARLEAPFALLEQGELPDLTIALGFAWVGCFVIPLDWDRYLKTWRPSWSLKTFLADPTNLSLLDRRC